jgi:hypothetical protein
MTESVLGLAKYRYFKWSLALSTSALALYLWDSTDMQPNGGTWVGYTLGTIGVILILWLAAFGIRKRRYHRNMGLLSHWLSAHIWLGISLVLIASLHAGFQFGWNVHTLAYVLMVLVVVSGIVGVMLYRINPGLMSEMLGGQTLIELAQGLREIDQEALQVLPRVGESHRENARACLAEVSAEPIANRWLDRLLGGQRHSSTSESMARFEQWTLGGDRACRDLMLLMVKRDHQLSRIRRFVQLKAFTEAWLLIHVPASMGLLASLVAHIVSVFFYW